MIPYSLAIRTRRPLIHGILSANSKPYEPSLDPAMSDSYPARGFPAGVITLDSANETYWAGSRVAGTFKFTLDAPLTFQAINMVYQGEAQVKWSDTETRRVGGSERTFTVPYAGRENYFQFMQTVAGGNAQAPTTLNPGTHSFDFHYQMPSTIPSSFEHENGFVRYTVTATLNFGPAAAARPDMDVVKLFTIVAPYDLNKDPSARDPINFEFQETPGGCCSCSSGSLSVRLSVPYTGFCPGQCIPIEVVTDNSSSIEVQKINIFLRKKLEFHSSEPRSDLGVDNEVLERVKRGPVPARSQRSLRVELDAPAELCVNLTNCSLIDINYYIEVEVKLSGCNEDCSDVADLIIGTIPLSGLQDAGYRHPLHDQLPALPPPTPEAVAVAYPTNTPYPTPAQSYPAPAQSYPAPAQSYPAPAQNYPGNGYSDGNPYPGNFGFNVGDHPSPPPPYPGYPYSQSAFPEANPAQYPAAPYPGPATNNASFGWSKEDSAGRPSAPPS